MADVHCEAIERLCATNGLDVEQSHKPDESWCDFEMAIDVTGLSQPGTPQGLPGEKWCDFVGTDPSGVKPQREHLLDDTSSDLLLAALQQAFPQPTSDTGHSVEVKPVALTEDSLFLAMLQSPFTRLRWPQDCPRVLDGYLESNHIDTATGCLPVIPTFVRRNLEEAGRISLLGMPWAQLQQLHDALPTRIKEQSSALVAELAENDRLRSAVEAQTQLVTCLIRCASRHTQTAVPKTTGSFLARLNSRPRGLVAIPYHPHAGQMDAQTCEHLIRILHALEREEPCVQELLAKYIDAILCKPIR